MSCYSVIAIDGPSASGKSTLAKELAKKLKFDYLDTGAMYRAFAWQALKSKIGLGDKRKLVDFCKSQKIKFVKTGGKVKIFINGRDVTNEIRTPEVSEVASILSGIGGVRRIMKQNQRRLSKGKKVILEGRDIGTVVFPKAACKIFLDASIEERINRRCREFLNKGEFIARKRLKEDLIRRDNRDRFRKIAPLRKARDAIVLDSTNLSIPEMVEEALKIVSQKLA